MTFKLLNLLAQCGIGYLQRIRGSRKATDFGDPDEGSDCLHMIHDMLPYMTYRCAASRIGPVNPSGWEISATWFALHR
jgi:hypothetical protein